MNLGGRVFREAYGMCKDSGKIRCFKRLCCVFFPFAALPFLSAVYGIWDCGALGIIFARVNGSPWEYMKPAFWCCLVWWSLELLCGVKRFKIYVKGKIICLFLLCAFCCAAAAVFTAAAPDFLWWQPAAVNSALCLCFYVVSNIAVKNIRKEKGFGVLAVLLGVMVGAVFCFSLYPPPFFLFMESFCLF